MPGPGEKGGGGEIWEGGVQRARDCDEVPAREIAVYQRTHTECAPGRELPGVQPPPGREPPGVQPPAGHELPGVWDVKGRGSLRDSGAG